MFKNEHVKNGLKTILSRSGTEIIDFLCFDNLFKMAAELAAELAADFRPIFGSVV